MNIKEILNDIIAGKFTKEHIELLQTKIIILQEENIALKNENSSLKEQIKELSLKTNNNEFIDLGSFLLKKQSNGSILKHPYCPKCKEPLDEFADMYVCQTKTHSTYTINIKKTDNEIFKYLKDTQQSS